MKNNIIFKDYFNKGQTLESFENEVKKIVSHTTYVKTYPANIRLLSFRKKIDVLLENGKDVKRSYLFRLLDKESLEAQAALNISFPEVPITTTLVGGQPNDNSRFLDQVSEDTGLMIELLNEDGNSYYYGLSEYALPMLATKAGLKGDRVRENSFFRDVYLANGLINPSTTNLKTAVERARVDKILSEGFSLALRKNKPQKDEEKNTPIGTGIVLSTFSANFDERDANAFLDIINALNTNKSFGESSAEEWVSKQDRLLIRLTFDNLTTLLKKRYGVKKDVKAQIQIQDSDCGLSSLTVQGLVKFGDSSSLVIGAGIVQERNGFKFDIDRVMKKIEKEILVEIQNVFKNIAKLESQNIPSKYKSSFIKNITKTAIKSLPSASTTLGKKRIEVIKEIVSHSEMSDLGTVYDVVDKVLSLPNYVEEFDEFEPLGETAYNAWVKENGSLVACNYNNL